MDITTETPRSRARAHLLSYRGHALMAALAIAVVMAAMLVMAVKAAPEPVQRVPLHLDEPGPPPIVVAPTGKTSASGPAVGPSRKMKSIPCPDAWERPNVTCWRKP